MMVTWRMVYRGGNPKGITIPDFEESVKNGFKMWSRYFNVDFQEVFGSAAAQIYVITSPVYYNGLMWADPSGQWAVPIYGGKVPAIWVATHRSMGSKDWVRIGIAHELGHWFTGMSHSTSTNDIMHCCNPPLTNWSPADYNRIKARFSPRGNVLPWNDTQWWNSTPPVPPPLPVQIPVFTSLAADHVNWSYYVSAECDVILRVNGKELPVVHRTTGGYTDKIPVVPGRNNLKGTAFNKAGSTSTEFNHDILGKPKITNYGVKDSTWTVHLSQDCDVIVRTNGVEKSMKLDIGLHHIPLSLKQGINNLKITATNSVDSHAIELDYNLVGAASHSFCGVT